MNVKQFTKLPQLYVVTLLLLILFTVYTIGIYEAFTQSGTAPLIEQLAGPQDDNGGG